MLVVAVVPMMVAVVPMVVVVVPMVVAVVPMVAVRVPPMMGVRSWHPRHPPGHHPRRHPRHAPRCRASRSRNASCGHAEGWRQLTFQWQRGLLKRAQSAAWLAGRLRTSVLGRERFSHMCSIMGSL